MNQRIVVVGTSGTGKSTFSKALAQALDVPCIELDALHWEPNWGVASLEAFRGRVSEAIAGDSWVVDGNYKQVRDLVWSRATKIIWLDLDFRIAFGRMVFRTLKRSLTRETLWNGNREPFLRIFTKDSMLLWVIQTHGKRRKDYPELFRRGEYSRIEFVRLRNPKQVKAYLAEMRAR